LLIIPSISCGNCLIEAIRIDVIHPDIDLLFSSLLFSSLLFSSLLFSSLLFSSLLFVPGYIKLD
jgi:hypothetical protein